MHKPTMRAAFMVSVILMAGAAASSGLAAGGITVTVNGVDVTGLSNQKFEGCTVTFDSKGNVAIKAPGYEIKKVVPDSTASDPVKKASLSNHYYIFTESKNGVKVGDEYALIVNDKVVKKF
ncbi:MAG: hypothetical protein JRG91_19720, partial [Deltaproteobacteria bacterium]|nr:hypothetical protein [Deltaproteobacteria bacterium]